jgi:predicted ester cyclase
MMRNLGTFAALSLVGLVGCGGSQEPAAAPLAPPPPAVNAAPAPLPVEAKKEEPKPVPLTGEQKAKLYNDGWAAYNAKDFAKFQAIWADNATSEMLDMGAPLVGPSAIVEQGAKGFATAFPDSTGEIELTLINGNNAVGVVLLRGTQTGTYTTPMGAVPATNKKVGFLAAHSIEFNDAGKAVKELMAYDGGTVAGQLGLMNMPHRKVVETGWAEKPVVIASGSDGEKANVAAFTKEVEGFNKHDAAGALGTAADDIVFSEMSAPADRVGKKEALKGIEEMFKGFPDAKLDVKSVWGAGDYVVAVGTWSGTNTGDIPSMKLKKTGKAVTQQFVEIDKFSAGKTKNIWLFSNGASAAAQLGLMPPPGAAKGKDAKPAAAKPEAKPAAAKPEAAAKPAATKPAAMKPAEPAMKAAAAPAAKPAAPAAKPAAAPAK